MTAKLKEKVQNEQHHRLENASITTFMENMVRYMIGSDSFFNVPLPELMKNIAKELIHSINIQHNFLYCFLI